MRRFVFLDRDGVVNRYRHMRWVNAWPDFEFAPGALEALRRLALAGCDAIVLSNQAGVDLGHMDSAALAEITRRMVAEVAAAGGRIADVLYCPHRPDAGCACRKPAPGLLLEAARRHGVDLASTWFVGDGRSDVEAGRAAGCRTILVLGGRAEADARAAGATGPIDPARLVADWPVKPDAVVEDLGAAVERILRDGSGQGRA